MTTNNHYPVATGAAANAATINTPLGQLDERIGSMSPMAMPTAPTSAINAIQMEGGRLQNALYETTAPLLYNPDTHILSCAGQMRIWYGATGGAHFSIAGPISIDFSSLSTSTAVAYVTGMTWGTTQALTNSDIVVANAAALSTTLIDRTKLVLAIYCGTYSRNYVVSPFFDQELQRRAITGELLVNHNNIVWDPFNVASDPAVDFGARRRWWRSVALSVVDDATNPFGAQSLEFAYGAPGGPPLSPDVAGKLIYCDEIGAQEGDQVDLNLMASAASGNFQIAVYTYDATGAFTHDYYGTSTAFSGSSQTLNYTLTIPADTKFFGFTLRRASGTATGLIQAMWGRRLDGIVAQATPGISIVDAYAATERVAPADFVNRHALRDWHGKIADIEQGTSTTAVACVFGDSWVQELGITYYLRRWAQAKWGDAGVGWINFSLLPATYDVGVTYSTTGTWTTVDETSGQLYAIDLSHLSTTDAAATLTFAGVASTIVLHWYGVTSAGTFEYRVDGGSYTAVNTSTSTGYQTTTIGSLSDASHTIDIRIASAGNGVRLLGAELQRAAPGVRIHKMGNGGSETADWVAADSTNWDTAITAFAPNLCVILLGTNDQASDTAPDTYGANLETMIDRIRAAMPNCDVLLWSSSDNPRTTYHYRMSDYAAAMRTVAINRGVAFFDGYRCLGDYATADDRGLYRDIIHPNTTGYRVLANAVIDRLMPDANAPALPHGLTYTTGTWTPSLAFGGATTGIAYTARTGRYIRIGNLVWIMVSMLLSSKGSATGSATLTGLPFTVKSGGTAVFPVRWQSLASGAVDMAAYCNPGATTLALLAATAAATSLSSASDTLFGNTTALEFAGMYEV